MLQLSISGPLPELARLLAFLAQEAEAEPETVNHHFTKPMITAPVAVPAAPVAQPQAEQPQRVDRRRKEHKAAPAPTVAGPFGAGQQQQQQQQQQSPPEPAPAGTPFGQAPTASANAVGNLSVEDTVNLITEMYAKGVGGSVDGLLTKFGVARPSELPDHLRAAFIAAGKQIIGS